MHPKSPKKRNKFISMEPQRVVRGRPLDRKPLPKELEAFAAGEAKRPFERRREPHIRDPRVTGALLPGVANRDARDFFTRRVDQLRAALAAYKDSPETGRTPLAAQLTSAKRLRLWRAGAVTSFDSLILDVLAWNMDEANALAAASPERVRDTAVALLVRTELALYESGAQGSVELGENESLVVTLRATDAPKAFSMMARKTRALETDFAPPVPSPRPASREGA